MSYIGHHGARRVRPPRQLSAARLTRCWVPSANTWSETPKRRRFIPKDAWDWKMVVLLMCFIVFVFSWMGGFFNCCCFKVQSHGLSSNYLRSLHHTRSMYNVHDSLFCHARKGLHSHQTYSWKELGPGEDVDATSIIEIGSMSCAIVLTPACPTISSEGGDNEREKICGSDMIKAHSYHHARRAYAASGRVEQVSEQGQKGWPTCMSDVWAWNMATQQF